MCASQVCLTVGASLPWPPQLVQGSVAPTAGATVSGGKLLLNSTRGGAIISILTRTGNSTVSLSLTNGVFTLPCASAKQTRLNASYSQLDCVVPPGGGSGYALQIQFSNTTKSYSFTDGHSLAINYPLPTLNASSLSLLSGGAPSNTLQLQNTVPTTVVFHGSNFYTPPTGFVSIHYGPASNPMQFTCQIDAAHSTWSQLACATQGGALGSNLVFIVEVFGQTVVSTFVLNYPSNGSGASVCTIFRHVSWSQFR